MQIDLQDYEHWGLTGWVLSFVKGLFWVFIIVVVVLVTFPCFIKCLQKSIGEAFLIKHGGGVVEAHEPTEEKAMVMPWRDAL